MKELSIEEKAKAYDIALDKIKMLLGTGSSFSREELKYVFPELCESEDEMVKKAIRTLILSASKEQTTIVGVTQSDMLAYLEKQGEQNVPSREMVLNVWELGNIWKEITKGVCNTEHGTQLEFIIKHWNEGEHYAEWLEKQGMQKPVDKVEPKFKTGDWIIHNKNTELANSLMLVVDEVSDGYLCKYRDGQCSYNIEFIDKEYKLWTIQDAKDGDVLAVEGYYSPFVAIYKKQNEEDFDSYCFVGFDGKFYKAENDHSTEGVHPATKEQRDALFVKMKEAGYEWDADKKELKKIEQNTAWGEEDDKFFKAIIRDIENTQYISEDAKNDRIKWLNSIKDRVLPQPQQEWSEEDIKEFKAELQSLMFEWSNKKDNMGVCIDRHIDKLLYILCNHTQSQWKPSDEQMKALKVVVGLANSTLQRTLESLYNDLKKLREE